MSYPSHLRYSASHVWVSVEDSIATVGLTDDVQETLGMIESVDSPLEGDELEVDFICMSFHVKLGLHNIHSPLSGRVIETNPALVSSPDDIFCRSVWYGLAVSHGIR